MHKKTISAVIILLLSIVFITGCGGQRAQDDPSASWVPTGTEGVIVNFMPEQPPAKLYTGSTFIAVIEVKNKGTYDVPNVDIFLSGYDPNLLMGIPGRQSVTNMEGKSALNPDGDFDTVEFTSAQLTLPLNTPSYRPNILLSACYLYETHASPIACFDPNSQYKAEDKACTVTNLQTGGSQGAPIAVTSIEAQATPNEMIFRIHISNVGGGQVFDKGSMQNCPFEIQYSDLEKIYVEDISIGTGSVKGDCKPSNPVRLVNGQATLFCKFPQQGGSAFQTPLNVKLAYGYKNSVQRQIEIQNLDQ